MPNKRRPPGTRQDTRKGRRAELAAVPDTPPALMHDGSEVPTPPADLTPESVTVWEQFWTTHPVVPHLKPSDLVVVTRWIGNYDEWAKAKAALRLDGPVVEGSKGQPRQNPMIAYIGALEAAMRSDEKALGIGPKARSELGIAIGNEALTAAQLNRMHKDGERGDDDGKQDPIEVDLLQGFEDA